MCACVSLTEKLYGSMYATAHMCMLCALVDSHDQEVWYFLVCEKTVSTVSNNGFKLTPTFEATAGTVLTYIKATKAQEEAR